MKMRLKNPEFLSEHGGRLPAGAVLDVPDGLAERWMLLGIAKKASASAKTYAQERMEQKQQEEEEAALNAGPVYNAMVTRRGTSGADLDARAEMDEDEDDRATERVEGADFEAEVDEPDDKKRSGSKRK